MSSIGERIKQKREEFHLSQSELARRMHALGHLTFYQMTVSRTEKGTRDVSLTEAAALSSILGVTLDWLAGSGEENGTSGHFQAGYTAGIQASRDALANLEPATTTQPGG